MATHKHSALSPDDIRSVSPTLASMTGDVIENTLWKRPGLSVLDRCVITVAALTARAQTIGMAHYFNKAMDNGVTAKEMSEIVLHLAFYAGWSNAFNAVALLKDIFAERGIDQSQLPEISPDLLAIESALPDNDFFMSLIDGNIRPLAPAMADFSIDLLYHTVWLRPDLSVRDRNLASLTALIALGLRDFLGVYMARGIAQGITREEMGEVITHIAFYAGWPIVVPAISSIQQAYEQAENASS